MSVDDRRWYEADVLMTDLSVHRHWMLAASEEEIERSIRERYADVVVILAREMRAEARRGPWFPARSGSVAW